MRRKNNSEQAVREGRYSRVLISGAPGIAHLMRFGRRSCHGMSRISRVPSRTPLALVQATKCHVAVKGAQINIICVEKPPIYRIEHNIGEPTATSTTSSCSGLLSFEVESGRPRREFHRRSLGRSLPRAAQSCPCHPRCITS